MMGPSHAITGAAAWLAISTLTPGSLTIRELDPYAVTIGTLVCAGAALLPDADHPSATIANSIPIVGKVGTNAISGMVGGHRHGTHSLIAIPVIVFLAWTLQFAVITVPWWHQPIPIGASIAVAALTTFAIKVLRVAPTWPQSWLYGIALGALIAFVAVPEHLWVPEAIVVGFIVHLIGDFITIGGLPLLWPLNPKPPKAIANSPARLIWMPNGYWALPILGKTGSPREWVLATITGVYVAWMLVSYATGKIGLQLT